MKKEKWIWMPHAAHLICARNCQFILNTYVGKYIVSTVGEYLPDAPVREIFAQSRNIELKGKGDERLASYMKQIGFEEIGADRKYETMVFKAKKDTEYLCCPYKPDSFSELDFDGYKDPVAAFQGHLKLCNKWSKK